MINNNLFANDENTSIQINNEEIENNDNVLTLSKLSNILVSPSNGKIVFLRGDLLQVLNNNIFVFSSKEDNEVAYMEISPLLWSNTNQENYVLNKEFHFIAEIQFDYITNNFVLKALKILELDTIQNEYTITQEVLSELLSDASDDLGISSNDYYGISNSNPYDLPPIESVMKSLHSSNIPEQELIEEENQELIEEEHQGSIEEENVIHYNEQIDNNQDYYSNREFIITNQVPDEDILTERRERNANIANITNIINPQDIQIAEDD